MNALRLAIILALALLPSARAAEAGFFRVTGPVATKITGIGADGMVTWTNAVTNATFTVQRAAALPGATNWNDYVQVPVTNETTSHWLFDPKPPANMALIPAGNFVMGDTFSEGDGDERPTHTVYVSAFYMDKYELTKANWDEVREWALTNGYSFDNAGLGKAASHPVHTVSWYDMVKWCNARSQKEGKTPAYYTDVALAVVYKTGQAAPYVKWNTGYRLPTEAEWEKAARGGLNGKRFPWGDTISWIQSNYHAFPLSAGGDAYDVNPTSGFHPSYNDGTYPPTSPVGSFAANGYGLHDMTGNVWEWCWDRIGSYGSASQTDPRGPTGSLGSSRVMRGGSWRSSARYGRAAGRDSSDPTNTFGTTGFRLVLPPGQ